MPRTLTQRSISELNQLGCYHITTLRNNIGYQRQLVAFCRWLGTVAPLWQPVIKGGKSALSVKISGCGDAVWNSSEKMGYHYAPVHPITEQPFPPIPDSIRELALVAAAGCGCTDFQPNTLLVNWYSLDAKLGMHQDKTEINLEQPIVTISLGASAWFEIASDKKTGTKNKLLLESGDIVVMARESRNFFHSVTEILPGTDSNEIVAGGKGRLSITIRQIW